MTSIFSRSIRTFSSSSFTRKLDGKVAIVTASTDGIGYAIARRLGQDGAKVVISSRKQKNVDAALEKLQAENLSVSGLTCHAGEEEDRKRLVEHTISKWGGIDILISNAAANPHFGNILSCSEAQWDKIFDINVKAAFLLSKAVVPEMEKRGGGSILFISSIAGYQPFEFLGPYSVSKTALLGLTKALTYECSSKNIRVNCVAPGIIETNFSEQLTQTPAIAEALIGMVPLKRFGKPEEIAGVASFLVSDDASYVTGETILATGGIPARL